MFMRLLRRSNDDSRSEKDGSKKQKKSEDKKQSKKDKAAKGKENLSDKKVHKGEKSLKAEKAPKEKVRKDGADPELAGRLREYGENYGLEEDPYLEGLSNAIDEGKNLAIWASNDVMTLLPHPDVDSVEGAIYSAMVLVRNVLVFVPVALTWLAVGKATTGFSLYTAKSSAASVVNFLQFWQNGYGVIAKEWTLSHVAEDDFFIIATVIILTFITPFMNRSAIKKAAAFEQDALRERLSLVIEVESFLFDKRRLTPLSIDSSLAQSFERVVEATRNLALASKRIEIGMKALPRQIESANQMDATAEEPIIHSKKEAKRERDDSRLSAREIEILQHKARENSAPKFETFDKREEFSSFDKRESERIANATETLDTVTKRVDVIVQSLPRRAHARKELKKVEIELTNARGELAELQGKLSKQQKKAAKRSDWKAAKQEAERNRAIKETKKLAKPAQIRGDHP